MNKREKAQVAEAYARCETLRRALREVGGCMEVTEDKAGIVWERYLLNNGRSALLFSTPHWCDVFVSVAPNDGSYDGTIAALKTHAAEPARGIAYGNAQGEG